MRHETLYVLLGTGAIAVFSTASNPARPLAVWENPATVPKDLPISLAVGNQTPTAEAIAMARAVDRSPLAHASRNATSAVTSSG